MGDMYIFDLCTGMRLGELLGLKWSGIDFEKEQLHIRRTIFKAKDPDNPNDSWHLDFGPPKTLSICAAPSIESAIRPVSAAFPLIVCVTPLPPEGLTQRWMSGSCRVSLDTPIFKRQ